MMPPEKMAEIGEAMAAAIYANPNDNLSIHSALWAAKLARITELESVLARINEKAVQLRDEIGTGSAVGELRARIHNLVELTRTTNQ